MAHWGEAAALLVNPFTVTSAANLRQGRALLAEAKRVGAKSEREAGFIEALGEWYGDEDPATHRARVGRYEQAMERLHARFPDEPEVAIHYALALAVAASPTDKTYAKQLKAGEILEREAARQPQHPGVAHYLIHAYDVPALAKRGRSGGRSPPPPDAGAHQGFGTRRKAQAGRAGRGCPGCGRSIQRATAPPSHSWTKGNQSVSPGAAGVRNSSRNSSNCPSGSGPPRQATSLMAGPSPWSPAAAVGAAGAPPASPGTMSRVQPGFGAGLTPRRPGGT